MLVKNEILEKEVKTLAKSAPVLTLENVKIGSDTFNATLNVSDPDGVYFKNQHNYFKLTNINNKQDYHSSSTLNFEGITSNATYKLTYNYYYDFKEGEGKVTRTFEYTFTTLNKMRINSFKITPPNFESSKYIFEINFNNPNFLELIGFTINGKLYTPKESFRNSPVKIVIEDTSIFEPNKNNIFTISSVSYYSYDTVETLECIGEISQSILIGNAV